MSADKNGRHILTLLRISGKGTRIGKINKCTEYEYQHLKVFLRKKYRSTQNTAGRSVKVTPKQLKHKFVRMFSQYPCL
jgi:hypothetical protein